MSRSSRRFPPTAADLPTLTAGCTRYGRTVLYVVDAKTGKIVESFGNKGRLQVADAALRFKYPDKDPAGYQIAGPPAYHNGTLYVGLAQSESHIPGGLVLAIDGRTGAVKWVFNTIPQGPADDGWEVAKDTWRGGARAGGGMWTQPAIDPDLGLLYVNAGNPSPDYDGSARKGMNLFTNAIIALHMQTGKMAWYYQTIHHEVWDFDLVTGPVLFDMKVGGRTIKGVASGGKNCYLYIWHRETGQPMNPMVEMQVPTQTDVPGRGDLADAALPLHGQGRADAALLPDVPDHRQPRARQARAPDLLPVSVKENYILSHGGFSFGSPAFSHSPDSCTSPGRTRLFRSRSNQWATRFAGAPVPLARQHRSPEGPTLRARRGRRRSEHGDRDGIQSGDRRARVAGRFCLATGIGSAGNLATAGDLVFQGSDTGDFYAFDARTGRQL